MLGGGGRHHPPPPRALLICVIVSITYQEELLSLPWLPCQQESLLCRQVTLNGWKGGIRADLQLENQASLWGEAVGARVLNT